MCLRKARASINTERLARLLADPYAPGRTTWFKILNRAYSQKEGRSDLFERFREH